MNFEEYNIGEKQRADDEVPSVKLHFFSAWCEDAALSWHIDVFATQNPGPVCSV